MKKSLGVILKSVLEKINPLGEELKEIKKSLEDFLEEIKKDIKKLKIDAEVFVGGSFAKETLIKKGKYDIDIFIRFDKKHKEISDLTEKILKQSKRKFSRVHGSRDYFSVDDSSKLFFEVVPVKKIKKPEEAENTTDLSYSHVKYIKTKFKSKNIMDEIKISKAFCHANNFYGAESYIRGFSGYSLELITFYYGGFEKFIKEISKNKGEKIVIDIEKFYKKKGAVLLDLNSSKLKSPIILIDPTYKQRNALAALSNETFEEFKKVCREFLKNPSIKFFEQKKILQENLKNEAKRKRGEFAIIEAETNKQEGDIAGGKLFKFYKYLNSHLSKFFEIKKTDFEYKAGQKAKYFFIVKRKKERILNGPFKDDEKNSKEFRKKHKNIFIKGKKLFAKEKINISLEKFIENWKKKYHEQIEAMDIIGLEII